MKQNIEKLQEVYKAWQDCEKRAIVVTSDTDILKNSKDDSVLFKEIQKFCKDEIIDLDYFFKEITEDETREILTVLQIGWEKKRNDSCIVDFDSVYEGFQDRTTKQMEDNIKSKKDLINLLNIGMSCLSI